MKFAYALTYLLGCAAEQDGPNETTIGMMTEPMTPEESKPTWVDPPEERKDGMDGMDGTDGMSGPGGEGMQQF